MSKANAGNDIRLEFEGLGPVLRGSVETRPLTVFIGPNGSGKSYTAMLLYALCRRRGGEEQTEECIKNALKETFGLPAGRLVNAMSDVLRVNISDGSSKYYFTVDRSGNISGSSHINIKKFYMYYLPASRSGLLHAYVAIAKAAVSLLSRPINVKEELSFPGISAVFIDILLGLSSPYRDIVVNKEYKKAIDFLENNILEGSIYLKENRLLLHQMVYRKKYRKKNEREIELPVIYAASGVSELAPLALFLKYMKPKKMDYLIIEEPEAHLHPELQRQVARLLAMLVRSGVRVLVTTHSDYLLHQLNIFLQLSKLSEEERKELGYMEDEYLRPDDVGAYLFKYDAEMRGYVTEELPTLMDEETREPGIPEDALTEVAFAMGKEVSKIAYMIERGEQEDEYKKEEDESGSG